MTVLNDTSLITLIRRVTISTVCGVPLTSTPSMDAWPRAICKDDY